jgi:hypothetical protein
MKNLLNHKIIIFFFGFLLVTLFSSSIYGQEKSKNQVRIQGYFFKIMDSVSYIDIKATSKIGKKNTSVSNIEITVYNEIYDESIELGSIRTNLDGKGKFIFTNLNKLIPDSTRTYNIQLVFKGDSIYKKAKKSLSFKNANISTKLLTENKINFIKANVLSENNSTPITDESITIRVKRLFRPLTLNNEFVYTDENGGILFPIEEGIPGINGNLVIEVVLFESDDYGTVIDLVNAQIGIPMVDESTYDERTMWSPRNKTPIFLLVIPNLLTFGMWAIIIILIINLFKIAKS